MTDYTVRRATIDDLIPLSENMREEDIREVRRLDRDDILDALIHSCFSSDETWVATNGEPFAIWGVGPMSLVGSTGVPWMLATPRVRQFKKDMVLMARRETLRWLDVYSSLVNYIDAEYTTSLKWAKHVGFEVTGPVIHRNGNLAYKIEMRRQNV